MLCSLCNALKFLSLGAKPTAMGFVNGNSAVLTPLTRLGFSTSATVFKSEDWKAMIRSLPKRDEGVAGERDMDFDPALVRRDVEFPDHTTPTRLYNGVPFSKLPMVCVRTSKNNTHVILADDNHKIIWKRSCGSEGFKNCRKGTNVAAQTTAITVAKRAVDEFGMKQVRVKIRGFGPGRLAAVKGLEIGGLDIVSVSDVTFINWRNIPKPRKQKRL